MSNRFKSLVSDSKEKDKKKIENKEKDKNKDNLFKNRFNILNENDNNKEKEKNNKQTSNIKKEKNTRFDSLLINEEVKEEEKVIETTYKNTNHLKNFLSLFQNKEKPIIIEKQVEEPIVFDSLVSKNIVTTTNTTLNFKDKLTTINTEPKVKKFEQKNIVIVETNNDLEKEKAKQEKKERKEATIVMSKIITQMVANGERQKRFYDSIYGAGAYDANYERIIDKYEVIYGKDSWFADGEEYYYINDYDVDSDEQYNSDDYDYTNETINDANNRYKWL